MDMRRPNVAELRAEHRRLGLNLRGRRVELAPELEEAPDTEILATRPEEARGEPAVATEENLGREHLAGVRGGRRYNNNMEENVEDEYNEREVEEEEEEEDARLTVEVEEHELAGSGEASPQPLHEARRPRESLAPVENRSRGANGTERAWEDGREVGDAEADQATMGVEPKQEGPCSSTLGSRPQWGRRASDVEMRQRTGTVRIEDHWTRAPAGRRTEDNTPCEVPRVPAFQATRMLLSDPLTNSSNVISRSNRCSFSCPSSTVTIQPPPFVLSIPGPSLYCPDQPLGYEQCNPCAPCAPVPCQEGINPAGYGSFSAGADPAFGCTSMYSQPLQQSCASGFNPCPHF